MKRIAIVLAAVGLATATMTGSAFAAKPKPAAGPRVPTEDQIKKGMADAAGAVTAAGLTCTVSNAWWQGQGQKTVAKKKVLYDIYEVSCSEGPGFIITRDDAKAGGATASFTCLKAKSAYDASAEAVRPSMTVCVLPENAGAARQFQPTVTRSGLACTVKEAVWIGGSETQRVDRYEFTCNEGGGYLYDLPYSGTPDKAPVGCLQASAAGYECRLVPKADRIAFLVAAAAKSDRPCAVKDARWVGADPNTQNNYYEVACDGKPGYFMELAATTGAIIKTYDCVRAQTIGGGCTLTDLGTAKAEASTSYGATFAANGIRCTPSDFRLIGRESRTGRDVLEFQCPERKTGLVALIPGAGASSRFDSMDCFTSASRALPCKLTPQDQLMTTLKGVLTAAGKTCDPSEFRVIGPDEGEGDYVEVKCAAGQEGYVVDMPQDRSRSIKTQSCTQAESGLNPCEIPGNK